MTSYPHDNKGKMNLYAETVSRAVGMDLMGFFKSWGWPIEASTEDNVKNLPSWTDHPMVLYDWSPDWVIMHAIIIELLVTCEIIFADSKNWSKNVASGIFCPKPPFWFCSEKSDWFSGGHGLTFIKFKSLLMYNMLPYFFITGDK